MLYLSLNNSAVSFTKSGAITIYFYPLLSYDTFQRGAFIGSGSSHTGLDAGYYYLNYPFASTTLTFSYPSASYPCPFDSAYPDQFGIFAPCTGASTGGGSGGSGGSTGTGGSTSDSGETTTM